MKTINARGEQTELTPNCNLILLDPSERCSIQYAKARAGINADFQLNFPRNEALARRLHKDSKKAVIEALCGVESKNDKQQTIVVFPDQSVARK